MLVAYPSFQIPLNPPFLKGEISHNDLDGTTIKSAKIYKTGGLEIKDTFRTTALPHLDEAMVRKDGADLFPGEDTELTQPPLPFEVHTLPHVSASESPRSRLFQKITIEPPEGHRGLPLLYHLDCRY